ncbi:MAG: M24 family metallopeptidase [Candidatus Woesearchaeota archaeon]
MITLVYERADHPDIYYAVKWASDVKCLYVVEERVLYVPGFEYLRAKKEVSACEVRKLEDLKELLTNITAPVRVNTTFPHALTQHIQTEVSVVSEIHPARRKKTSKELLFMQEAQKITQEAIQEVIMVLEQATLREGVAYLNEEVLTSEYLKQLARTHLLRKQADCKELIIASGEQTSQPHNRGSGPIREGPVIIDIFAQSKDLYYGDCTRTYILGEDQEAKRMLAAVKQAHDECIQLCKPGIPIKDLHLRAEKVLKENGFQTSAEEGFIHSLGHGVGLEVHEAPGIHAKNEDVVEEQMVFTIEPGLYYKTGVRHENIIVVTKQGARRIEE